MKGNILALLRTFLFAAFVPAMSLAWSLATLRMVMRVVYHSVCYALQR